MGEKPWQMGDILVHTWFGVKKVSEVYIRLSGVVCKVQDVMEGRGGEWISVVTWRVSCGGCGEGSVFRVGEWSGGASDLGSKRVFS